jgi:TetR/AcrR family transcriptional repressor of mexJK operon
MGSTDAPGSRRAAILKAARLCFLDRGFVRTSISDVIALSGGSRATVYDEFGSKEGLFAALIASILEQMRLPEIAGGPPEDVLREVGLAYMQQLMDPEALALYRVVLGESTYIRQLGPAIFEAGPRAAAAALAGRLAAWTRDGTLAIDDPQRAAALFLAMVEGDLHRAAILWSRAPTSEQIAGNVEAAVALFLDGARARGATGPADAARAAP